LRLKPAKKIRNFRTLRIDVQVLNTTAIESGYAGRVHKEGLAMEAFK